MLERGLPAALENGDEKAVGAVPCRSQSQIPIAIGHRAADRVLTHAGGRQQNKSGLSREKGLADNADGCPRGTGRNMPPPRGSAALAHRR
jgi:hypothetical protein